MDSVISFYADEDDSLLEYFFMEVSEKTESEIMALIQEMNVLSRAIEDEIIAIINEMIRTVDDTDLTQKIKQNSCFTKLEVDLVDTHDRILNYYKIIDERRRLKRRPSLWRTLILWFKRFYLPS